MRLTRPGIAYIVITLLIGFAAVNTGNNLLYLIVSALLGFMTVSGVAGWLNIRGLALQVRLPDEIYADQETFAYLVIVNRKRFVPSFLLRVSVEGGGWADFNLVERQADEAGSAAIRFPRRGIVTLGRAVVSSPFPINFFVRSTVLPLDARGVVFPSPLPCAGFSVLPEQAGRGGRESLSPGYEGEVDRISDYTGTEPFRLIHWRLSARHGSLKVKGMTAVADEPIILDPDRLPGSDREERIRCGVWLVNRAIRANRPVGLFVDGRTIAPDTSRAHRLRLLTELALHGIR
ncbi:DUF58 domain-containing protein [Geobacter sulfurreducens]|uniref:Uncharacterized protein n=2 Tax=Geobacter sulfurreducens TaxID=35554 RepID=I7EEZ1_GEOSL|nr:protein of unknown function DUF58 [Geobacter sulfurreducens KN400]AFP20437.1 protein of unknown function DUF58 [Geobacter sulfurreducens PCA]AJY71422.1 hypothetical protein RW64_18665 [Geobacter sulfurreducens]QVW36942.1 DUF58 domain-containing protein [Geobacter sulfurreducens]UAC05815.1 DUF58 domain-containing protein [Geobacter sulfurreducens]